MSDGKIVIDTELDSSGAEKSASKLGGTLKSAIGKSAKIAVAGVAALGASVTAASGAMVKSAMDTADYGDRVDKMSQKIGMSTKSFQEWDFVLQQNGSDISGLRAGMKTLSNAANKNNEAFKKLGISQKELKSLSPEQLFERTVEQLQKMPDSTERTALATTLLGRSATELKPLLNQTAEATKELKEQANEYGMVMSEKAVKASATFNDSLNKMKQSFRGAKNGILADLLPAMTKVTDGMAKLFKGDMSGVDDITKGIDEISTQIQKKLPSIIEAGGKLIGAIGRGIIKNIPTLISTVGSMLPKIIAKFGQMIPKVFDYVSKLISKGLAMVFGKDTSNSFKTFANSIKNNLVKAFELVKNIVQKFIQAIAPFVTTILDLASYIFPALVSVLEFVSRNFEALKNVLIVVLSIWIGMKVVAVISALFSALPAIISAVTAAFEAMKLLLMTHPLFLLAGVIGAVTAACVMFNSSGSSSFNTGMDSMSSKADQLNAKIQEQQDAVKGLTDNYKSLQEQSNERVGSIGVEMDQTRAFWEELQGIVDQNGNIKKGYEDRAKFITGELSNALGIEFEWDNKKITNMSKINGQIKRQIAQTMLMNTLEAKRAEYNEAKKNEVELSAKLAEQQDTLTQAEKNKDNADKKHLENVKKLQKELKDGIINQEEYDKGVQDSAKELGKSVDAYYKARDAVKETQSAYEEQQATIHNYESALKTVGKSTKAMNNASTDLAKNVKKAGRDSTDALKRQSDDAVKNYEKIKKAYEKGSASITKEQVDNAKKQMDFAVKEYGKVGKNTAEGYIKGIEQNTGALSEAVRKMVKTALEAGKKEAKIHSPSRATMEDGKFLAQGWVKGFENEKPEKQIARSVRFGMRTIHNAMNNDLQTQMNSSINIGFEGLGDQMVYALQKSGLGVNIDGRTFGRIVRSV